jgi:FkbM family methyltransferase
LVRKKPGPFAVRAIGSGLAGAVRAISIPFGKEMGSRIAGHASQLVAPIVSVQTPRGAMRFWCPSSTSAKYAVNFMRYEPDTREWIETHVTPGQHMWDVGANIGAYTLYASLAKGVTVTAFEPVAATYGALVTNISLNPSAKDTVALALALSDGNAIAPFYLRNTEAGGAMHALGAPETFDGRFEAERVEHVVSIRGDELVERFGARRPDHIKLDVDGHELRVLKGLSGILSSVRTLWIETEEAAENSGENARIENYLSGFGFAAGQKGRNQVFINKTR